MSIVEVRTGHRYISVRVSDNPSIRDVRKGVSEELRIPEESFHLLVAGKHLADGDLVSNLQLGEDNSITLRKADAAKL